jgi:hypothetical protein
MKPSRVQFTLRRLMIGIALATVAVEAGLIGCRVVSRLDRAYDHDRHLNSGRSFKYDSTDLIQWHERMRLKYENAARYPWLPVEPDPPEPK